jgi:hypothetical protein
MTPDESAAAEIIVTMHWNEAVLFVREQLGYTLKQALTFTEEVAHAAFGSKLQKTLWRIQNV